MDANAFESHNVHRARCKCRGGSRLLPQAKSSNLDTDAFSGPSYRGGVPMLNDMCGNATCPEMLKASRR